MSMQVRAGYLNPLSMKRQDNRHTKSAAWKPGNQKDPGELQIKRQQLQNQMLLLKAAGTDAADISAESRKELESELEAVTTALRSAKSELPEPADAKENAAAKMISPKTDSYQPEKRDTASFGSYRLAREENGGCQILFSPFSEK